MAAGATYTPIATYTTGSSDTQVVFSSIPQTYTTLVLVTNLNGGGGQCKFQFNGDTSTNYGMVRIMGDGTTTRNGDYAGGADGVNVGIGMDYGTFISYILNYKSTSGYKTLRQRVSTYSQWVGVCAGYWNSTAAITQIRIWPNGSTFGSGGTATLYGITAA